MMSCHTRLNLFNNRLANTAVLAVIAAGALGAQTLTMVSGNGQIVPSQFKTNAPLVVKATSAAGTPAAGVNVSWAISGEPGSLSSTSTTTDANGLASIYYTADNLNTLLSYNPTTVTASAGSASVNFVVTTIASNGSISIETQTPNEGATLTGPSGATLPGAVIVHVYALGGFSSGQGIPNIGLRVANAQDPTVSAPAACSGTAGIALTDSTGTATCNLVITGPPGITQLTGDTGEFKLDPTFSLQITQGVSCTYSLSASSQSFAAAGGAGSVNVTANSGCTWTAVSNANFISITSGASGAGNGTVSYSVAANTGAARTGTLTVAGKTYTINQSAPNAGGLAVTTTSLPPGMVGVSYLETLAASGGQQPYTWSISGSLPSGLTLTPSTGAISGTPGSPGQYALTATVTDAASKTAAQPLSITINGVSSPGSFAITNVSFPNGVVGQSYSQSLSVANICSTPFSQNVNFAVMAGTLPSGLMLSTNPDGSHSIAGIPSSAGAFPFTLSATDACGHVAMTSFTIVITNTAATPVMTVDQPSLSFNVQNGSSSPAPGDQTIHIGANNGPLNYSVTVSTASGGNWLVAKSPTTGTTPGTFTVGIANYANLTPGPYNGSIVINSSASNSPVTVPVSLTVTAAAPSIVLQSATTFTLTQFASPSQSSTPASQASIVLTGSGGSVHFTASASTKDGTPWLSVTPTEGNTPQTLIATIDTGGLAPGSYTGTVLITPASGTPIPITFNVSVTQQAPVITSVVNAASFINGPVAPGEIVTIFGTSLGPLLPATLQLNDFGRIGSTLAGTQVLFDGFPAPLIYVSSQQISVVVPYEIALDATTSVFVQYLNQRSAPLTFAVAPSAPGIFTINGPSQGAILNQDGSVNSTSNGAAPGSIVSIFATGEGQTQPAGVDGTITGTQLPMPQLPVTVQIGGQNAQVTYAGAAPGEPAGVLQVNAMVPSGVQRGASVPITITVGNTPSQAGVALAIAP
ncbi:MAG TPA: putative Ig domain-containing protein [Bryobacteraceae bacterium]|nr:putative Ig domain-containing protein [Bryobacteraceae bacterium]